MRGSFTIRHSIFSKLNLSLMLIALGNAHLAEGASSWSGQPDWAKRRPHAGRAIQRADRQQVLQSSNNPTPFAPESRNLSIHVGQMYLMGDLSNNYSDNLGGQVQFTYGVSDIFGFDTSLGFSSHTASAQNDGSYSMMTLLTGLRTNLAWYDKVVPYVNLGLGFYRPSHEYPDGTSLAPVLFGLHAGPGVDLQLTDRLFFGVGLTFHNVFGTTREDKNGTLREVGGTFTSFLLHTGMSF